MSKTIFISHSTINDKIVDTIATALKGAGFSTWVDHDYGIEPGMSNWDKAIRDAIDKSDVGVLVMSEAALASDICAAECLLVRQLKKDLYVLLLEKCDDKNVWLYVKMIQYADLTSSIGDGVSSLIRVLKGEKDGSLPKPIRTMLTGFETLWAKLPLSDLKNPLRGRDEDVTNIQNQLGSHVLQIVAAGGTGKSRLVAEIAQNHPDGAIWHRCEIYTQKSDLFVLLCKHVGKPYDTDISNILELLAEKRPLVVVDNAEDVKPNKRQGYADLLHQLTAKNIPVILTSRMFWDEFIPHRDYPLSALKTEADQLALDFATVENRSLTPAQAVQLATKARSHPGLIQVTVRILRNNSFAEVQDYLEEFDQKDIKTALNGMILKTVQQMPEQVTNGAEAKVLLHRLTILRDTFDIQAAKALAPETMTGKYAVKEAMDILQDWQFVRRDPNTERYSLAELVREALGQPDEVVFMAYAQYFTARAAEIFTLPLEQWKNHDHDLPNILALGDELVTRHAAGKIDYQTALDFALNTNRFVTNHMEYRRLAWLDMGLAAAHQVADKNLEGLFLNGLGRVWNALGENHKALAYYKDALLICWEVGNRNDEATTLNNIGLVWNDLGDKHEALACYENALSICHEIEDLWGLKAAILSNIGMIWGDLGDKRKSLTYYEEALSILRDVGDDRLKGTVLNNIGTVWDALGDKPKALAYYEDALLILRATGDHNMSALTCWNIGKIYDVLNDLGNAIHYIEQCVMLMEQIEHPRLAYARIDLILLENARRNLSGPPSL